MKKNAWPFIGLAAAMAGAFEDLFMPWSRGDYQHVSSCLEVDAKIEAARKAQEPLRIAKAAERRARRTAEKEAK